MESCCITKCELPLDGQYWDNQWLEKTTGWDIGYPAPAIVKFIDSIKDKKIAICIPGCGSAYEAEYIVSKGFQNITLVEISETAAEILKKKFENSPQVSIVCEDFFTHQSQYDLIIEQTFFCALPPYMRQRYAWKMYHALKNKGKLTGLLFNRDFDQSPPFGGSQKEYEALFKHVFQLYKMEMSVDSIPQRAGTELNIEMERNESNQVNLYSFSGMHCGGCKAHVTDIFGQIDGVLNVSISTDYSEVLIVSKIEISIETLAEKIAYEENYSIEKI